MRAQHNAHVSQQRRDDQNPRSIEQAIKPTKNSELTYVDYYLSRAQRYGWRGYLFLALTVWVVVSDDAVFHNLARCELPCRTTIPVPQRWVRCVNGYFRRQPFELKDGTSVAVGGANDLFRFM